MREDDGATGPRDVDVLVAGLGPGGCVAALQAHGLGLRTLAVEARGPEATRARLVLVRPQAQDLLRQMGMADITQGRRASTIRQVEERLRGEIVARAAAHAQPGAAPLAVSWHTRVAALEAGDEQVRVTLRDETTGAEQMVSARYLIDATGGRLEGLGRVARRATGASHIVVTAEYETAPWFDGLAGARDPVTREALILVPMRGRVGVTAYLDTPPGAAADREALVRRFERVAERLALRAPRQEALAVDVVQLLLPRPSSDRVLPIGDSVGTVDLWLGAGMSTAIEDAADAARAVAAARQAAGTRDELAPVRAAGRRILARHRSRIRLGRLLVAARPLIVHMWPTLRLDEIERGDVRSPRGLWPAMRLVAGRRPG